MRYYKVLAIVPVVFAVTYYLYQSGSKNQEEVNLDTIPPVSSTLAKEEGFSNVVYEKTQLNNIPAADEERGYVSASKDDNLEFLFQDNAEGRRYLSASEVEQYSSESGGEIIQLKGVNFALDPDHIPYIGAEREYVYLQLSEGLTQETQNLLAESEIELAQFIDKNTWLVNISNDQAQELARLAPVYALGERDIKDKVSPDILKNGVRELTDNGDSYSLIVEVLSDGELTQLNEYLVSEYLVEDREKIKAFGQTSLQVEVSALHFEALVKLNVVSWVENKPAENTVVNANAAALSNIDTVRTNFNLQGTGVGLGIWDEGNVDNHNDFGVRLTNRNNASVSLHSTHVAGTMIGDGGFDINALGMAPAATLDSYDWTSDSVEMRNAAINQQVDISNHSYGSSVGWTWNGTGWVFNNNQDDFGRYDARAREWDDIVNDENLIIVKAAGNDRGEGAGVAAVTQPVDGGATGFDTVSTFGNAKNIITVGAVTDTGAMTNFSAWGPSNDGRIKPDLVANGQWLRSTALNGGYTELTGTSMAAPVVAGASALLFERFNQVFGVAPQASLLKATLLHTATDLGNPGPDYDTGWGLVNLDAAINLVNLGALHVFNRDISNNKTESLTFVISPDETEFKLTMVWTDPRAAANAAQPLINDLDVRLVSPSGTQFFPWIKNADSPANAAIQGDNQVDNIEQIVVILPEPGAWTANITGAINQGATQQVSVVTDIALLDVDSDNDWLPDDIEIAMGLDPFERDIDGDGLTDYQEVCFDGDCSDYSPFSQGRDTDARNADTDNDNLNDGDEIAVGRNPLLNEPVLIVIITSLLM